MTTSFSLVETFNNVLSANYSTLSRRTAQLTVVFDIDSSRAEKFSKCKTADILLFSKRECDYRLATKMVAIGFDIWDTPGTSLDRFLTTPLEEERGWAIAKALAAVYSRHLNKVEAMAVYATLLKLHCEFSS